MFAAQPAEIGPVGGSFGILINFLNRGRASQLFIFAIVTLDKFFISIALRSRGKSSLPADALMWLIFPLKEIYI